MKDWSELPFFSTTDSFIRIVQRILSDEREGKIVLPPRSEILNAFVLTPFDNVKVVVFGQDPYHQTDPQYAHGLAFSCRRGTSPIPKSLANIFRELNDDTGTVRRNGDLSDWARQGVLLLNSSLTVVAGTAGSHSQIGWKRLSIDVIESINANKEHVVFVLWGKHAQQLEMYIDRSKHFIIKSAHPSPLSAHRGFFGSKVFSEINKYLDSHNIEQIRWGDDQFTNNRS